MRFATVSVEFSGTFSYHPLDSSELSGRFHVPTRLVINCNRVVVIRVSNGDFVAIMINEHLECDCCQKTEEELFLIWNESHTEKAFTCLFNRVNPLLIRCLKQKTRFDHDAEDGAQVAWFKAYPKRESIHRGWLIRVAINYLISNGRTRREHLLEEFDSIPSGNTLPNCEESNSDRVVDTKVCIEHHSGDRDVEAFKDRHYHGLSISEIAQRLDCTQGAASSVVLRGKMKMLKCLQRKGHHAS